MSRQLMLVAMTLTAVGCGEAEEQPPEPEPLVLPEDPAESGVPVGVRTEDWGGTEVEVWYPASDATTGASEAVDFNRWMPASVEALLGPVDLPLIPTDAVRDAQLRVPETPYPVVFFSHGFGGTHSQSTDLTVHLASRGYVVVATDHAGRSFPDLLPCLFEPPVEGCDLAGMLGGDPGEADLIEMANHLDDAASDGFFAGAIDPNLLGVFGHSAGGGSTSAVLQNDERFLAGAPMAGGAAVSRDVPVLMLAGDCDATVPYSSVASAASGSASADLVTVLGAGHLAFSDLCELDFGALYEDYLADRSDLSAFFADSLLALGTDGCPGSAPPLPECGEAWLDLAVSDPIARYYLTVFFDAHLRGQGSGIADGGYPEATLSR